MPFPNVNPVAFALGPLAVRWYALAYLFSIGFGALYGFLLLSRKSLWSRRGAPFRSGDIFDFAFWAVAGVVLGGRLGYVLFYNLPLYAAHPLDALKLWDGGMSFYGGVAGLATAAFFYTRSRGGSGLSGFDLLATVAPIGLLLGRLANFINGELYGSVTTLPLGGVFPFGGPLPRHPSQLNEGLLEGAALFLVLLFVATVAHGLRRPGLATGIFGIGYALSRILVEFVRIPDPQLGYVLGGWVTMGKRIPGAMRDTVLVPPLHAVTITVDADNPCQWAFHCHHLYHMENGMMTTFSYRA